ncbi:histidine kinase [Sphingobacterium cellulitidis]|uniref:Histidine kinase n=2 Tax=Sphingobacteriaceae TaxID=84566 RepID=A0A8H9KS59_9SPHI|nr:histidine kinase [Sphingobacterium soli]
MYSGVKSQNRIYNFLHFTEKEGLSSNEIHGIAEDNNGLIWMSGRNGLSYFDGHSFNHIKFDRNSDILMNYLGNLTIDAKNRIWITTNSRGLICYDRTKPEGENLKAYQAKVSNKGLIKTNLYDVLASKSGLIYFSGQETDLQSLNPETGEIKQISIPGIDNKNYLTIFSLDEDSLGNIWMGTRYNGLIYYNPNTHASKQIDLKNPGENAVDGVVLRPDRFYTGYYDYDLISADYNFQQVQTSILGWNKSINYYDNSVSNISYWPVENKVLIGHVSNGLYTYQIDNQKVEHITLKDLMPLMSKPMRVHDFCVVKNGYWMASDAGLFFYSSQLNQVNTLIPNLDNNPITELFRWKGQLWYKTENSFGELDEDLKVRKSSYSLNSLKIGKVTANETGIYFSTLDNGVYQFVDPKTGLVPLEISGDVFGFRKADCNSILLDTVAGEKVLWIGSWNSGLYKYHLQSKTIELFDVADGLPDPKVICVGMDAKGSIWLGMDGYGLVLLENKIKPRFLQFSQGQKKEKSIQSNTVFSFFLDHDNRFWFCNSSSGIAEIIKTPEGYDFVQYPEQSLQPWLYTVKIQQDKNGLFWMKSLDGTMLFQPQKKQFFHLNESAGIYPPEEIKTHNYFIDADRIVWCTDSGLISGALPKFQAETDPMIKALLNKFTVQHLDRSYELLKNSIHLKPDENNFSISFSAAEQIINPDLKFQYRLVGFDEDWISSSSDLMALYNNLEGGDYVFQVRVADQFGNWSSTIRKIPIKLDSHWYATIWFKIFFVLLFVSIISLFFLYRIKEHKKINKLQADYNKNLKEELIRNEIKIKEQAADIEKEKQERLENDYKQKLYESELKAIRSQMNPHFIFNVLNSIEAYVVEKDSKSASDLIQKFASISRLVLENSQFSTVSLKSEIMLLKLYLELEQERFNHAFDFDIALDDNLNNDDIKIPSMLIQPVVENAVHHGVRHLKKKKGLIKIVILEDENKIIIKIMDNGLGFKENSNLKSSAFKQSSFGLKGVLERINIINSNYSSPIASLAIEKLVHEDAFTTAVIITLPLSPKIKYPD